MDADPSLDCLGLTQGGHAEIALGVRFLEPRHLVGVAAVAHRRRADGQEVFVHRPPDNEKANYASRMHLPQILDSVDARHDLPTVRERRLGGHLLEVTLMRTASDARSLAELVHGKVAPTDIRIADALWESLTELGANVQDHATAHEMAAVPGFCAAQMMPRSGEVVFAVADAGVGLLRTLAGRNASSDREALVLALSGTSRLDEPDRGRGLPNALDLISELGGELYLATGTASATATSRGRIHGVLGTPFRGTLIQGRVPVGRRGRPRVALPLRATRA